MATTTRWATAAALMVSTSGCAASQARIKDPVEAIQASAEIPEEQLLDIGVQIFDPGIDESQYATLTEKGIFPEVRKSELRFMPFVLKETMESTGQWGAVRVIPSEAATLDVVVRGEILKSNGKDLVLDVEVRDATGRKWLEKRYKGEADQGAYHEAERAEHRASATAEGKKPPAASDINIEPYQSLYNQIANDVLAARRKLDEADLLEVRRISRLRFAAELAPAAFTGYLVSDDKGRFELGRLPASEDPMLLRIDSIRERDQLFVDTLNEFYANFHAKMDEPYDDWRRFSYVEQLALEELNRQSKIRKIIGGVAAIVGVVTAGRGGTSGTVSDVLIIGGVAAVRSGMEKGAEAQIHKDALAELGASFDSEVEPLLVEVEGQTMRLTGSAETQFAQWRKLLKELFVTERGLPIDPNSGVTVEAPVRH